MSYIVQNILTNAAIAAGGNRGSSGGSGNSDIEKILGTVALCITIVMAPILAYAHYQEREESRRIGMISKGIENACAYRGESILLG